MTKLHMIKNITTFVSVLIIAFVCKVEGSDLKYDDLRKYEPKRILDYISLKTSSPKPVIDEKSNQSYLSAIYKSIENFEEFNRIIKLLVEDILVSHNDGLNQQERGILLSLCMYHYSKTTGHYWAKVKEVIGDFPDMNLFFDTSHGSFMGGDEGYATYSLAPNKLLFLQLVGRGNHNNSYILWQIKIEGDNFNVILLDVPQYIEESKSFKVDAEFIGSDCSFDFEKKQFTVNVNCGDVNGWKLERNIYQVNDDKLDLIESSIYKIDKERTKSFSKGN